MGCGEGGCGGGQSSTLWRHPLSAPCPPPSRASRYDPATGLLHATPNWNLVNLVLRLLGPCNELWLCLRILLFQVACCVAAFAARHALAGVWKS